MDAVPTGAQGVVVFRRVPIRPAGDQRARAYLRISGAPRDLPSHQIRVYLGDVPVSSATGRDHPSYLGRAWTYNSPPAAGPRVAASPTAPLPVEQEPYEVLIDLSDVAGQLDQAAPATDVTLVMVDRQGNPLDAGRFLQETLEITRSG